MTSASSPTFALPLLEWAEIPAGSVMLDVVGSAFDIEAFKIARYPVTNAQFEAFIQDQGYKNAMWWEGLAQPAASPRPSDWREPDCPKLEVCWYEAVAFCRWLAHQTEFNVRLPTEWEWQWAAVGNSGWDYPYGSTFDSLKCSTKESGLGRTHAVTHYADVKTHFNTVDMSGHVWEWCLNEGPLPQNIQHGGRENRALRGGSWNNPAKSAAATFRSHRSPQTRTFNIGFRVVIVNEG